MSLNMKRKPGEAVRSSQNESLILPQTNLAAVKGHCSTHKQLHHHRAYNTTCLAGMGIEVLRVYYV